MTGRIINNFKFLRSVRFYVLFGVLSAALVVLVIVLSYFIVGKNHDYALRSDMEARELFGDVSSNLLVLGSAVASDGQPKGVLAQRLDATLDLYSVLDVDKIIVSGYASRNGYSEPVVMKDYLVERDVVAEQIVLDERGVDTSASCSNARQTLGEARVIVVTQPSHIDRAIFLCRSQGLEAFGYSAGSSTSGFNRFFQTFREALANVKAVLEVAVSI